MAVFYNEYRSKQLLKEYGLPTGAFTLARSRGEALQAAEKYGFPLAMKIVSDQIIHKTEAKGIKLNIMDKEQVAATFDTLCTNGKAYNKDAVIDGVMVSPMVPEGIEVIIGGIRDVQFGPVVMFGLGGVFVEIFKDVKFRMAPLGRIEALKLIRSIQAFPLLNGARGRTPANIEALGDVLVKTSDYLSGHPEVTEIDLNPVSCFEGKVQVLDASIGVKK
jgi:succinyl-CoA synthetase beta subunit